MLDDSYVYQEDFDKHKEKFKQQDLSELYASLYTSFRLTGIDEEAVSEQIFNDYVQAVSHAQQLLRENHQLQQRVHQLGIKNRVASKIKRSTPQGVKLVAKRLSRIAPTRAKDKVRRKLLLPSFEVNKSIDIASINTTSSSNITEHLLLYKSFINQAVKLSENMFHDDFEQGLRRIQKQIPKPRIENPPLVSVIVPTRNGLTHLERLFNNFDETTNYSNYEVIVVDNASTDGTKEFLKNLQNKLNLRVITNTENKSFSESNNIASKKAKGSFLLFLNNDITPTHGWLAQLVSTALKNKSVGAVGAKLIYPYKPGFENSHKIQHGGLGFKLENGFIRPINLGVGEDFLSRNNLREEEKAGVTAACMLVEKTKFNKIGGFEEAYWYGYEDVDLCLKLREAGYKNVINNAAVLFHHEFGTQDKFDSRTISGYRKKNMVVFRNRWQAKLYPMLWRSVLGQDSIYSDKKLHVGFIVTEVGDKAVAGDYMTAKELGEALEKKGCRVSYIGIKSPSNPYDIDPDIDVLISMIDGYDISRVTQPKAVKIAWCRNWFERWAKHSYFRDFDIVLSNSEKAQKFFKDEYFVDSYIFKIATNKNRFTKNYPLEILSEFKSDICFTGNYWHVPRDISSLLDVEKFKDRFSIKIFGKDWDHVQKLKPYWRGFLEYKNIPKVYAASKILIDDATFVVNEWGSVNSRVFDGAASGVLVLTNGVEGSRETFDGLVPTFTTKEDLSSLLEKYLDDDSLRQKKIDEIKSYVLKHHTYEHRADQLFEILENELTKKIINIKLPIPRWNEAKEWGDLHFGQGLKHELENHGYKVKLQILPEWNKPNFAYANIVIRGLSVFDLPSEQINVMWNISHPDNIPFEEYKAYDYVFVASKHHANNLTERGVNNIHVLHQCFDETIFNTDDSARATSNYKSDILFVGNTRGQFRKIVRDIMSWEDLKNYNFKVYGKGWDKFIDKKYIAGDHINNSELKYYYQNTKILLNDHWDDMNKNGFISNRLFDASACGAFIISDLNPGIEEVFGPGLIEEYTDATSLHQLLSRYLNKDKLRTDRASKATAIVKGNHTFRARAIQLSSTIHQIKPTSGLK